MLNKFFATFLFSLVGIVSHGQTSGEFRQWYNLRQLINPANLKNEKSVFLSLSPGDFSAIQYEPGSNLFQEITVRSNQVLIAGNFAIKDGQHKFGLTAFNQKKEFNVFMLNYSFTHQLNDKNLAFSIGADVGVFNDSNIFLQRVPRYGLGLVLGKNDSHIGVSYPIFNSKVVRDIASKIEPSAIIIEGMYSLKISEKVKLIPNLYLQLGNNNQSFYNFNRFMSFDLGIKLFDKAKLNAAYGFPSLSFKKKKFQRFGIEINPINNFSLGYQRDMTHKFFRLDFNYHTVFLKYNFGNKLKK
jgi:hypothetical protein